LHALAEGSIPAPIQDVQSGVVISDEDVVGSISDETVRRTLKKTRSNRGKFKVGVSPR